MKRRAALLGLCFLAACATAPTPAPVSAEPDAALCTVAENLRSAGETRAAALDVMKSGEQAALLMTLPDCLESPDPKVRDRYAYEVLSALLRSGGQASETLRTLKASLMLRLATADSDPNGFRGPFAALALAEVARTDRIAAWMTETERSDLIDAAHSYLAGLTDYRGFSDTEGWRHGVAHTADLLMQMSLNPNLTKPQAEAILAAIAVQVGTPEHAYIFGESERLAAPVIYLAGKPFFTELEWVVWFDDLWPAGAPLREVAYSSEAALAKLHNLRAFSEAVFVSAAASENAAYEPVAAAALSLLNALP